MTSVSWAMLGFIYSIFGWIWDVVVAMIKGLGLEKAKKIVKYMKSSRDTDILYSLHNISWLLLWIFIAKCITTKLFCFIFQVCQSQGH